MARMDMSAAEAFPTIRFKGTLRPSQADMVAEQGMVSARTLRQISVARGEPFGTTDCLEETTSLDYHVGNRGHAGEHGVRATPRAKS